MLKLTIVFLLSCVFLTYSLHPEREEVFSVVQDTYLSKQEPNTNFGAENVMLVGKSPNKYITLIQFDTSVPACNSSLNSRLDPCYTQGISHTVDRILYADISLPVKSVSTHNKGYIRLGIYPTNAFNETSATWNNAGETIDGLIDEISLRVDDTIAIFDVTEGVQKGYSSFVIKILDNKNGQLVEFDSKESGEGSVLSFFQAAVELTPPDTGCSDHFVEVEGITLSYTDCPYYGCDRKPPVCLWIHGAPTNKDLWRNQHQYVQSACRSIAVSMPGSGLSEDVDLEGGTKPILTATAEVIKAFVEELDLKKINCIGQDFGDGVCRMIELAFALEGKAKIIDNIWSIEGVMENHIMCSPENESAGLCARDGSVAGPNSFQQKCFIEDITVTGDPADKCGSYILKRNWFYNAPLFFDPNVKNQSMVFPILSGLLMPVSPILIAFPSTIIPCSEDVINILTFDCQPPELANEVYNKSAILSLGEAPQVLQNWPRTLAVSGQIDSVNSAPYRQLLLDTREAYEEGGLLAKVPKYYLTVTPGIVAAPKSGDVEWATDHYANFHSFVASRGAIHYFTEDNTGAQDVGLWIASILE